VAEFFIRQQMKKDQPQNAERLKSVLAATDEERSAAECRASQDRSCEPDLKERVGFSRRSR